MTRDRPLAADHWRRPLRQSPFHPRIAALMETAGWYDWAGTMAPTEIADSELEYFAIRSTAALFDISPMIKYDITGPDAERMLNRMMVRDVRKLAPGRVHYTAWCDDDGQVLDDGTLFRLTPEAFRICCQERHLPWLMANGAGFDVAITDVTEALAGLAIQGPTSAAVLRRAGFDIETLRPFAITDLPADLGRGAISRTGFTGDLGYEIFLPAAGALDLWDRLMAAGEGLGIRAIGYEALNIARIEAGFIVANADFSTAEHALRSDRPAIPQEIGLGWLVDMDKGHFNGRRAIARQLAEGGPRRHLVGLEIEGNEPATHALIYRGGKHECGIVTAGIWSPTAKRNIALASIDDSAMHSADLWVEIYAMRELRYARLMKRARIVPRPFVSLPRRSATPPGDF